ncbi:hypothetical protein LPJ77_001583 [Coemansia sp. RSA 2523]|nr:hypothetical protein LPJ77_001583 [Coemansia sp. RSA 2523]
MADRISTEERPHAVSDDRLYKRPVDAPRAAPRSLPNIKLEPFAQQVQQRGYMDIYAESYDSDSEVDDDEECVSPVEAVVLGFEQSAPRLPALRIGAARLSKMVHRPMPPIVHPEPVKHPEPVVYPEPIDPAEPVDHTEPIDHSEQIDLTPPIDLTFPLENNADGAAALLPKRLARPSVRHKKLDEKLLSGTDGESSPSTKPHLVLGEDECNGLLARGALGDTKQQARADGSPWQRLMYTVRSGRREREAKLFKPLVVQPGARNLAQDQDVWADRDADRVMSKFPFCCCAARYCVAFTFVAIFIFAIAGFFAWPRMPSVSISSITALAPAHVTIDSRRSAYGLRMPVRVTYEIHSGNFYPLLIRSAHVRGFDGVTGNRVLDTTLHNVGVKPLKLQFHSETTDVRYLTSDSADPALTDLFGKCAPRSTRAAPNGRPGALTIRFQITVDVRGLGWLKQPIVTLNQKVECPE